MNKGFTLAEVLITLGVIGVVAAISLPRFIDNMTERANSERHANIAQKVTQAMEQMRAHGLLNTPYPTTEAFVDELQNYLKIAKRCDKDHIADCWPTEKVTAGDGETYKISTIKNGKRLQLQTATNNVGLILADGSPIILNYNPDSKSFDIGDKITANTADLPVGGGKSKEFVYTSDVTSSIDFITDVNGGKKPNSETVNNKMHDIRSFNIAKIKGCAGTDIPGLGCVVEIKDYSPVTDPDKSNFVKTYCESDPAHSCVDYWTAAINACKGIGDGYLLPNQSTLKSILNQKNNYSTLPQDGLFWTSTSRNDHTAFNVYFGNGTKREYDSFSTKLRVLCVGD